MVEPASDLIALIVAKDVVWAPEQAVQGYEGPFYSHSISGINYKILTFFFSILLFSFSFFAFHNTNLF
jgi:hypothetical protein